MRNDLGSCRSYIECQFREAPSFYSLTKPFITISRQTGAGGITVARRLAEYMRAHDKDVQCQCPWSVFDREIVEQVIQDHGLPERLSEFLTEDKVSEIDDIVEELLGLHPAKWTLVRRTTQTILRLARMGGVILVGRGANVATQKFDNGFHVRLVGSFERRVRHMMEYYGLTRAQAARRVEEEDRGRRDYLKKYFAKNIDDPLLYDLIINTDRLSYEEASKAIGSAVIRRFGAALSPHR